MIEHLDRRPDAMWRTGTIWSFRNDVRRCAHAACAIAVDPSCCFSAGCTHRKDGTKSFMDTAAEPA